MSILKNSIWEIAGIQRLKAIAYLSGKKMMPKRPMTPRGSAALTIKSDS